MTRRAVDRMLADRRGAACALRDALAHAAALWGGWLLVIAVFQ